MLWQNIDFCDNNYKSFNDDFSARKQCINLKKESKCSQDENELHSELVGLCIK
jgi:hypothetical protein